MKVLFIYPDILNYSLYKGTFYTGIASLSAVLKQNPRLSVSLIHLTKDISKKAFLSRVSSVGADLIAFSSTSNMYPFVSKWASWIKEDSSRIVIACGGVHPTISPDDVIKNPNIDIVCIGEGEYSLRELCDNMLKGLDTTAISGLWVKDNAGLVHKNVARSRIDDLDSLPLPDRGIFDYPNLHSESEGKATVMLSRGCPYSCTYCCNDILRRTTGISGGKYVRFKSVKRSIEELHSILDDYSFVKSFAFDDDILPLDKAWFREFSAEYKKKIKLPYDCNLRPNLVNDEIVSLLSDSGCAQVRMGIESGNDFIRNKVLNRNITEKQLTDAFELCHRAGLKIYSYNMLGLPFEDIDKMLETVRINAVLPTSANQVTIFYPYEKTPLYDVCINNKLISGSAESVTDYSRSTMLKFGLITQNQIIFMQRYFRLLVKLYAKIIKLSPDKSRKAAFVVKNILFSPFMSLTLLPAMNLLMDILWQNKPLSVLARKFNRRVLKK